jgi:hypothetical protein
MKFLIMCAVVGVTFGTISGSAMGEVLGNRSVGAVVGFGLSSSVFAAILRGGLYGEDS